MDTYKLWEEYLKQDADHRPIFIAGILNDSLTAQDLRSLKIYFSADRPASLAIFKAEVVRTARDMEKEDGTCGRITVDVVMDRCRSITTGGDQWDIDKVRIANATLNAMYPDMLDPIYWTPEKVLEYNQNIIDAMNSYESTIKQQPVVVTFLVPVGYKLSRDERVYKKGYPESALRELECEYFTLNGEDDTHLSGDYAQDNEPLLPLNTYLDMGATGKTARFVFTAKPDYDHNQRDSIVKRAQEWLKGQLSDGWGEDMFRHEQLIGDTVLHPGFLVNRIRVELPADKKHRHTLKG